MQTSPEGRRAIMAREGVRLKVYRCAAGYPTIGCGHTSLAGPPEVHMGMLDISRHEAEAILTRDLALFESVVNHKVNVPLAQHEFDALVSLAFNIGGANFGKSTLLKLLNAGDRKGAADQFLVWNKGGGKTLKGLTTRRHAERAQFLGA